WRSALARQLRWQPWRTGREPLVLVLHVAYAFVPVGFLLAAYAMWSGESPTATGATHAWTVGAIGLMTLAVMTRSTRGHTGHPLRAPAGTVAIYALMLTAALSRIAAAIIPDIMSHALILAGVAWVSAFSLFVALYAPMLLNARRS
ncbi:MAG: NnrS family protein, partial [Blastochloris sp.]|nr:NnrS family protein [Blastochloris sp.]